MTADRKVEVEVEWGPEGLSIDRMTARTLEIEVPLPGKWLDEAEAEDLKELVSGAVEAVLQYLTEQFAEKLREEVDGMSGQGVVEGYITARGTWRKIGEFHWEWVYEGSEFEPVARAPMTDDDIPPEGADKASPRQ